ncbi:MAG: adenylate/guanylate cyclase domain-containing protein [Myxococcota bacterium]|nr:adenylate/guanylate cyclase domain-containing protein [Myxococcota bacterium]
MHETVDSHELLELLARLNRLLEEHHHENLNHRLEIVNNFLKDELKSENAYIVFAPQRHERQDTTQLRVLWDTHEPDNRAELDEEALGLHEITLEALAPLDGELGGWFAQTVPLMLGSETVIGSLGLLSHDSKLTSDRISKLLQFIANRITNEIVSHGYGIALFNFQKKLDAECDNEAIGEAIMGACDTYRLFSECQHVVVLYQDTLADLGNPDSIECHISTDGDSDDENLDPAHLKALLKHVSVDTLEPLIGPVENFQSCELVNRFTGKTIEFGHAIAVNSPYAFRGFYDQQLLQSFAMRLDSRIVNYHLLREQLGRFVDPRVARRIAGDEHLRAVAFAPRRANVAMLYADIVGFSRISEDQTKEVVGDLANDFLTRFQQSIFAREGIYDKSVGDCGIAIFGLPLEEDTTRVEGSFCEDALLAAIDIHRATEDLAEQYRDTLGLDLKVAIGIAVGPSLVGLFGPAQAQDFTAFGKFMNLAARLQGQAGPGETIVSRELFDTVTSLGLFERHPELAASAPLLFELKNIGSKEGFKVDRKPT